MENIEKEESITFVGTILQRLIKLKGTNVFALSKKTNIPQPTIQKIIKGATINPGIYTINKLARGLGVSPIIFFGYEDEQSIITQDELEGIALNLNDDNKYYSDALTPLYTLDDVNCYGRHIVEDKRCKPMNWFSYPYKKPNKSIFCIKIDGDSMAPIFSDGDIVFIDPQREYKNGDYVLVRQHYKYLTEEQHYEKYISEENMNPEPQIGSFVLLKKIMYEVKAQAYLASLYKDLPNQTIEPMEKMASFIIGTVLGKYSPLNH